MRGRGLFARFRVQTWEQNLRQPEIDWLRCLRLERERHFLSDARGVISGVHDFEHRPAVFAGDGRWFVFADAFDEMFELLRVTLVERFLEDRERPAFGRTGLLHGIAVTFFAV